MSKAFDYIVHDLLEAKLEAYNFFYEALKVMHGYLTDIKNITKINHSLRDFINLLIGVTQDSFLGPLTLFFIIYIYDVFKR